MSAGEHIHELQEAALACNVVADVRGASAARWSSRQSALTVSLVLLGLAGFLLALAADPGRSAPMANWLLRAGAVGAAVGVFMAASIPIGTLGGPEELDGDALLSFARDVASGQTHDCDFAAYDKAIKRWSEYGPAFAGRASARACERSAIPVQGVLTSDLEEEAVDAFRDDYRPGGGARPEDARHGGKRRLGKHPERAPWWGRVR